jgi:hypothetical protein
MVNASPCATRSSRRGRWIFAAPEPGQRPLPPDLVEGIIYSLRDHQIVGHLREGRLEISADAAGYDTSSETAPSTRPQVDASAGFALPDAIGFGLAQVTLSIRQSELGQFTLVGTAGLTLNTLWGSGSTVGDISLGSAVSAAVLNPQNAVNNAKLAGDPDLRPRISVLPPSSCPEGQGSAESERWRVPAEEPGERSLQIRGPSPGLTATASPDLKVTSADVLEALHRATGMPIVADYYTRLYPRTAVSVKNLPRFDALNHLGDAMHLLWTTDAGTRGAGFPRSGGTWLQFRSTSYYSDRLSEVPNRLLARWAASRRQHGALMPDDLMAIAQLSDPQLDSESMAEGARCCFGLREWNLARQKNIRPHWRYLALLSPTQFRQAQGAAGLVFTQMSLPQQQGFLSFALSAASAAGLRPGLEDLAMSRLRVECTLPASPRRAPAVTGADPGRGPAPPRAGQGGDAGLQAAHPADPPTGGPPGSATQPAVKFTYIVGGPGGSVWSERVMRGDLSRSSSSWTQKK